MLGKNEFGKLIKPAWIARQSNQQAGLSHSRTQKSKNLVRQNLVIKKLLLPEITA
jgi:hypothetical protein